MKQLLLLLAEAAAASCGCSCSRRGRSASRRCAATRWRNGSSARSRAWTTGGSQPRAARDARPAEAASSTSSSRSPTSTATTGRSRSPTRGSSTTRGTGTRWRSATAPAQDQFRRERQRRPRLRGADDLVLPRRVPAGQLHRVPGVGARGAARRPRRIAASAATTLAGADPAATQFIDGGVLDNKPFGWAIDAISHRRADCEVDRRLLYLEPDPGDRFVTDAGQAAVAPSRRRRRSKALLGATSGIPRHEPILDDLLSVAAHNERVSMIRDVIETSFAGVSEFLDGVDRHDRVAPGASPRASCSQSWCASRSTTETMVEAGLSYTTYLRLKISGVIDRYAETVCAVCNYPRRLEPRAARPRRPAPVGRRRRPLPAGARTRPRRSSRSCASSTSTTGSAACAS